MGQQLFIIFYHGVWGQCRAFNLVSIGSKWLQFISLLALPMRSRNLCIFWHSELSVIYITLCDHSWILLFIGLRTFCLFAKCNSEVSYIHIFCLQIFSGFNLFRTFAVKTAWIVFHHMNFLVKVLVNTSLLFNAPVYGIRSAEQRFSYKTQKNDTFQVSLLLKHRSEHFYEYVCCLLYDCLLQENWIFKSSVRWCHFDW